MPKFLSEPEIGEFRERLCEAAARIFEAQGPNGFSMRELADMMLAHDRQHCDEISSLMASSAGTP